MGTEQMPQGLIDIIDREVSSFKDPIVVVEDTNEIPHTSDIPGTETNKWLRINGPICVYADMANSTQMSATNHPTSTAKIYRFYTNTAVMLFNSLGASYIDIKGDGVFAMFDGTKPHMALVAAVSFKTFFADVFKVHVNEFTKNKVNIGNHIGIDQRTILVKKLGLRKYGQRSDKQNEVWAGRTVNMAAKLGALYSDNRIVVSDRFFNNLSHPGAIYSCGCPDGDKDRLWRELDLSDDENFDFDEAYYLPDYCNWCKEHGSQTLRDVMSADSV